jgi:hypothetical protein
MYPVIEAIVNATRPKRYLEVGVWDGKHLLTVDAPDRTGIDILERPAGLDGGARYFEGNSHDVLTALSGEKFDMIFVDGLHHYKHCIKDILLSVDVLAPGGVIVVHDVFPLDSPDEVSAVPRVSGEWTGDVWKVVPHVLCAWAGFQGYVVPEYPGYFVMWPTAFGLPVNVKWHLPGIDLDCEFPFDSVGIEWARHNRHIFNVSDIETVINEMNLRRF